ncbi:MAG TPA: HAMP domain-containing protein, partial [Candidatus Ozemobacteraceae bacterium]|nr:HAMP domain-containing protein [Candidatus Ozemobacteraceae bacterium]
MSAKFSLGTTLLVGLPMVVILFQALSQANMVRKAESSVHEQRLESQVRSLEQGVAARVLAMRNKLLRMMHLPEMVAGIEKGKLEHLLHEANPAGFLQYVYLHVSGQYHVESFGSDSANNKTQLNFVLNALSGTDFRFPHDKLASSVGTIMASGGMYVLKADQLSSMFDRLEPQQLGSRDYYMFSSFSRAANGSKTAFLSLSMPFASIRDRFLDESRLEVLEGASGTRIFYEGERSAIPQIDQFLETSGGSERTFHSIIRRHERTYLAIGRPLRGLMRRVLILSPMPESISTTQTYGQLAIILFLALIAALYSSSDLIRVFLEPLRSLLIAVRAVDNGNFTVSLAPQSADELGRLSGRFNGMVEGLLQRSRMSGYLRSDLLGDGHEALVQRAERRKLVVLFAGVRDFSRLESS